VPPATRPAGDPLGITPPGAGATPASPPIQRERASGSAIAQLRNVSHLLDTAFRLPGTRFRFGWDAVAGLLPLAGDAVTPVFGALFLVQAVRSRVPRVIILRMALNLGIDVLLGLVPVLGDFLDAAWRSHTRNFHLLVQHAGGDRSPGAGDWAIVAAVLILLVLAAALPALLLLALLLALGRPLL
jgi:hypothetical protein